MLLPCDVVNKLVKARINRKEVKTEISSSTTGVKTLSSYTLHPHPGRGTLRRWVWAEWEELVAVVVRAGL